MSPQELLAAHGLRATRQRCVLADLLFIGSGRHIDAHMLNMEAARAGHSLSLATVYNALREFEQVGLIRRVAAPSERVWYDTDTGPHRHFFIEAENRVLDMPGNGAMEPPAGFRITRVDTVVHLERVANDE